MTLKARVYIVDDDDAVRDSLGFQIRAAGYHVTVFSSAKDFLNEAPVLPRGCLILDVRMPEIDGLELQSRLNDLGLRFQIVMITGHGDVAMAVRAMKAGAADFVEKPFSEETILKSIDLAQSRAQAAPPSSLDVEAALGRVARLTGREREVLEGIVAGRPNKVIAFDLGLSARTVEVHRAHVMDKMQAGSLSELVRLALAAGVPVKA